jgi:hypothetical protein
MDDNNFSSGCILMPKPTFLRSCIKVHLTKEKCTQAQQRENLAANSSPVGSACHGNRVRQRTDSPRRARLSRRSPERRRMLMLVIIIDL